MGSISLRHVGAVAGDSLFQDINLVLSDGDRLGLIAGNGGGKTTLLRAVAGLAAPSSGEIVLSRGLTIGYVEQDVPARVMQMRLWDAVADALPDEARHDEAWRIDVALDEFATPGEFRERMLAELSGGWQRLALIARVWVTQPDALLLDEPTNHLDLARILQLEAWINQAARSIPVVIASHDRRFLDATTNRTLFLRPGVSRLFALPFSQARQALAEADAADANRQEKDLKEAKRLRRNAGDLYNVGINSGSDLLLSKAKQLKSRAAAIEDAQKSLHKDRTGDIRLANRDTHARVLATLDHVAVAVPDGRPLFRTGLIHVFKGDRIVVLGRNGTGKSQLMRLLALAMTGEDIAGIRVTPSAVMGYADQAMSQLPNDETPHQFITRRFDVADQRARGLLAGAGFAIEKQARPIGQLSYGQRTRLGLLALRLTEPNFYLLDEPTNHVDIAGQEQLEAEILERDASGILVSHDRAFVEAVATRFMLIDKGRLTEVDWPDTFYRQMREDVEA
ncbi:ABC-F family ATP-binding cassette domain-containing protein [Devosia nitrariae]|uniref:ABC transporter n=1 Tax=Devosia nitrariae TaxID=2071872 RepID=A0ABQ5WCN1_9HYPH|nr:ABC-F family ATP-binding cassette domain-containing protein [Devosia nitrariae]GLQ57705.1 ABC transporter [Devosia nitrariae]